MAFVDYITRVVITMIALIYPGYQSYKAIKTEQTQKQADWLQYWLVLSVISGLMLFIEPILVDRVPFWPAIKIAAVASLVHPKTNVYKKIYDVALEPQLRTYEGTIDDAFDKAYKAGQEQASKVGPEVQKFVQKTRDTVNSKLNKKTS